jgi:hypothetical protein
MPEESTAQSARWDDSQFHCLSTIPHYRNGIVAELRAVNQSGIVVRLLQDKH